MFYTIKTELLINGEQKTKLTNTMVNFNKMCNEISRIGYENRSCRNKIKLFKECNEQFRNAGIHYQFISRAVGKVVEWYKNSNNNQGIITFDHHDGVVYDSRLLNFKWVNRVSIGTIGGERIDVPFRVHGYRLGLYERRVEGLADLILQNNQFYLYLAVEMPETASTLPITFENTYV